MPTTATYYLGKQTQTFEQHLDRAKGLASEWEVFTFDLSGVEKSKVLQCFLLTRTTKSNRELDWISLFNSFLEEGNVNASLDFPFSQRLHALLGVHYAGFTFFLSYGAGHSIAKRLRISTRFGRVVAGNSKDAKATRQLKTFMHQFGGKETEITIARGDETSAFRTTDDMQTLRSVSTTNSFKSPIVAKGAAGYTYWSPESKNDLCKTLDSMIRWWNKGIHQDEVLAALERFSEVDDSDELQTCEKEFEAAVVSKRDDEFSAIMPTEYWNATGFQYRPAGKGAKPLDIVPWDSKQVLETLRTWQAAGNQLEDLMIIVHVSEGTHVELCQAISFLSWSFTEANRNRTYIWDEGSWFSIDKDWATETLDSAKKLFSAEKNLRPTLHLPNWSGSPLQIGKKTISGEDLFVATCEASTVTPKAIVFHRKLAPSPLSQVELCDVFWKGTYLLYCKHGSSFSPVHEVCGQALHAVKAIKYDLSFVRWFEAQLKSEGHILKLRKDSHKLKIGILLAVNNLDRDVSKWSMRSLHCLLSTVTELGTLNFDAELCLVLYEPSSPVSVVSETKKALKRQKFWKQPKPRKK